jgi:hypothetical protein
VNNSQVSSACQTHKNNFQSTRISSKSLKKHSVKGRKTHVHFALINIADSKTLYCCVLLSAGPNNGAGPKFIGPNSAVRPNDGGSGCLAEAGPTKVGPCFDQD